MAHVVLIAHLNRLICLWVGVWACYCILVFKKPAVDASIFTNFVLILNIAVFVNPNVLFWDD